jgi:hypothetical protein
MESEQSNLQEDISSSDSSLRLDFTLDQVNFRALGKDFKENVSQDIN